MAPTKKIAISLIVATAAFLNAQYGMSQGRSNSRNKEAVTLIFDYSTKTWDYEAKRTKRQKRKPYFLIPYKSQSVIKVTNCPSVYSVQIISSLVDIEPVVESEKQKVNENDSTGTKTFTQTVAVVDSDEVEFQVIVFKGNDTIHTSTAYGKVFGGLKVDVSSGALAHNVLDHSFMLVEDGSGQVQITRGRRTEEWRPLLPAVLTHFYFRPRGYVAFGLGAGLGISDDGKVGFYVGPSGLIGDRRRFVITGGLAYRPAARLKGKYTEHQIMDAASAPEETDLVTSIYRGGVFVALSYNLKADVKKR